LCQVIILHTARKYDITLCIDLQVGLQGTQRELKYPPPHLGLLSYVSAGMFAAGGFMALSIRSPIRFAARSSGSASRWA